MSLYRIFVRLASATAIATALCGNALAGEPLKAGFRYIGPTGDHGWTYSHDMGRKALEAKQGDKVIRVKYYSAVHSTLGAFFLKFYTGTTGMTCRHDGYHFKVGSCCKQLSVSPCLHMCHSLSQLGSPTCTNNVLGLHVLISH